MSAANPEKAPIYQRFFKTGPGEYGSGDCFLGLTVPQTRGFAKKHSHLALPQIQEHLKSKYHEERLAALLILVEKFNKASEEQKANIVNFYLKNTKYVNNWDLVDLSASRILGVFLLDKPKKILYELANSKDIWEKRISIIATAAFINKEKFDDTLRISEILLNDTHDLIHKAVGWMLREMGKKNQSVLETFLKQYYKTMPRTMLRYSIERFPEPLRKQYLKGEI
jgi:3-methyladenine DNA glycosylase AlkD|tara:strand:- start:9015 stop:9689 length:675 start_codon:yes stop_codon:yes gene_type:complete